MVGRRWARPHESSKRTLAAHPAQARTPGHGNEGSVTHFLLHILLFFGSSRLWVCPILAPSAPRRGLRPRRCPPLSHELGPQVRVGDSWCRRVGVILTRSWPCVTNDSWRAPLLRPKSVDVRRCLCLTPSTVPFWGPQGASEHG